MQKRRSEFSGPVPFCVYSLICSKYFALDCSLWESLGFKCNPPLFNSFEVEFSLTMTSNWRTYKCWFILVTAKEGLLLSIHLSKLEVTMLLSDKILLIYCFKSCSLPITTQDGSLTALFVLLSNTILLMEHFHSGLI